MMKRMSSLMEDGDVDGDFDVVVSMKFGEDEAQTEPTAGNG